MGESDLASRIRDYTAQAQGLEARRQRLVYEISATVRAQVIPQLTPLLPSGYSIDPDRTEVEGVGEKALAHIGTLANGEVPTGFGVILRLLYDGKPISVSDPKSGGALLIQMDLADRLKKLAKEYNLDHIIPLGEPVHMG